MLGMFRLLRVPIRKPCCEHASLQRQCSITISPLIIPAENTQCSQWDRGILLRESTVFLKWNVSIRMSAFHVLGGGGWGGGGGGGLLLSVFVHWICVLMAESSFTVHCFSLPRSINQWRNYGPRGALCPPAEICAPPNRGLCPPTEVCHPQPRSVPLIQNFQKIGPHLRLQDTKCSSIDMPPPRKSGAPQLPSPPLKMDPSYATGINGTFEGRGWYCIWKSHWYITVTWVVYSP